MVDLPDPSGPMNIIVLSFVPGREGGDGGCGRC